MGRYLPDIQSLQGETSPQNPAFDDTQISDQNDNEIDLKLEENNKKNSGRSKQPLQGFQIHYSNAFSQAHRTPSFRSLSDQSMPDSSQPSQNSSDSYRIGVGKPYTSKRVSLHSSPSLSDVLSLPPPSPSVPNAAPIPMINADNERPVSDIPVKAESESRSQELDAVRGLLGISGSRSSGPSRSSSRNRSGSNSSGSSRSESYSSGKKSIVMEIPTDPILLSESLNMTVNNERMLDLPVFSAGTKCTSSCEGSKKRSALTGRITALPNKRRFRAPPSGSGSGGNFICGLPLPGKDTLEGENSECRVSFRRSYDLTRHRESKHGVRVGNAGDGSGMLEVETVEGREAKPVLIKVARRWVCETCSGEFARKDSLQRHAVNKGHQSGLI